MSKPSSYGERHIRFCPKCGCDKLERDWFIGGPGLVGLKQPKVGVEYICQSCNFGFWVSKSRRVCFAEAAQKDERRRAPVRFTAACVGVEVANAYLRSVDPPVLSTPKQRVLDRLKDLLRSRRTK